MAGKRTLLWLGDGPAPGNVSAAAEADWNLRDCKGDEPLEPQFKEATLVAIGRDGSQDDPYWLDSVLTELDRTSAVAVFLLPEDAQVAWSVLSRRMGHFLCVPRDSSAEELAAKFAAAGALQKGIESLCSELSASRQLHAAGTDVQQIEEEMRLASKLQRDFLPKQLPEVGPVRFGVLYQPAGWVSGDIYDIMRLDETHVGLYVADVVGHGMPAALLTMFVKKALLTKRIEGTTYEIVSPAASLAALNSDICEQNLSSCQFCTAVYCVVDTERQTVTYSRAGHPEPIILRVDGTVELGKMPGSLLGIFPEEQFEVRQLTLQRGDRMIVYSDGAEQAILGGRRGDDERLKSAAMLWAGVSRDEMLSQVSTKVLASRAAGHMADDVTLVVMD
ncbi:MAG: PP2C family protein-serine/threonine phosphatase, partial [Planctomycetota bacterium]